MKKYFMALCAIGLWFCSHAQYEIRESIYFESDSFNLDKTSFAQMNKIKARLLDNPYHRIEVYANTDSIGEIKYNQELSEKRLKTVLSFLLNGATETKRIMKTSANGEKSPIADNGTEWGKHKNRRVDILVQMDKDTCIRDGCAKTCLPKGTFDPYFNREVKITLVPVQNFDQMRANNISPQTNQGEYLFSNGMMRITSTVNDNPVYPQKNVKISIPAHRIDPDMAIYEGSNGSGPVAWELKTIELKKINDNCLVYEIDGSWLNKWVNMDKPRPANNTICLDNPFIYLDLPMDGDSNKVIENDIILSFNKQDFAPYEMKDINVETGKITTMCDWIENNIISSTTDGKYLDKQQRVLQLKGFTNNNTPIEIKSLNSFTAYFPFDEKSKEEPQFFVAEKNNDGKYIWDYAGKPDSILDLKGCGCKYYVKTFDNYSEFISISKPVEKKEEDIEKASLRFKKIKVAEIFVYYKKDNMMLTLKPNEKGKFEIPLYESERNIVIIGKYEQNGKVYYFDEKLSKIRKGWFSKTKKVKKRKFKLLDEKKGLKLKNISCRKGKK